MQQLANAIQTQLETLVDQYDARLQTMPGYVNFPAAARRDLERQMLNLMVQCLIAGDSHELIEYSRQRATQWAELGLDLAWFQQALMVPEEILVPLIDSVEASTFLWQALNRSQAAVWQMVADRTRIAEQNLRQSQQLLQTVMDNIPQAVFWKDQNLTYLGCNRAFADDAALASPAEIVGKTDYDMPWQPQADLYRTDDQLVIDSGTAKINYEEPQTTPTGGQTWLRTSKVPMRDAAGKVTAVLGMYEDVTDRKRAEEALARERNLLRSLIDNLPDQIFFKDTAGRIILYNEADARAMGAPSTEAALGKTVYDLYPRELADRYHADDMAVIQSGHPLLDREEPGLDTVGRPRWILTTKVPLKDAQGNSIGLVGMARDITQRKQIEASLQQSEERFRRFSEVTLEGLVFHDEGVILDVNSAIVTLFGYTAAADILGRNLLEFIVPEFRALVVQKMQLDDVLPYEVRCIRSDGSIFPVETSTRTYQYGGRTVRASSVRDITQRKRTEQNLRDSEERLRAIYEGTNDAVMLLNEHGFFDCNLRTLEMFGFKAREEFTAVHPAEVSPQYQPDGQESLPAAQVHIQTAYRQGYDRFEWVHRRANGEDFPAEVLLSAFSFGEERVLQATVRDITERKQLEQQIHDSLKRRSFQVQTSTQVAQEIAAAADVNQIFPLVVTLIKERFSYYHTQIFRYESARDAVVLVAGYGEVGQRLLAAGHQLPAGRGAVGLAAKTGESILMADVARDPDWQPNRELPLTKGELAVPIKFQAEILGILDVQSDTVNALSQDDVLLLEGLAGQIAVAIANARALEEANTFRALVGAAGQGIAFADTDGRLVYANAAVTHMFGFNTLEELVGRSIADFYPAAEQARVQEAVRQAIQTGQWTGELLITPVDSSAPIPTINNVFPVRDRHGELRYIANIITNIADSKLAEQRLAEAIRSAKMGYWAYDVPTDTFTFNDQFYALMRTTVAREGSYTMSSARYAQRFVHPDDAPIVGMEIGKALETTDPNYHGQVDHRVIFGDGELGYITVRFSIEKDAQGRTIRTQGANQDITERKLAEEAIRRSEAQLSEALQIARLAYWEYDIERDLFMFNDQFYTLFHTTAARHGGYQLPSAYYAEHFVHPDDRDLVGAEIGRSLNSTDRHYNRLLEHRIVYADGSLGYISVNINVDRDEQGKILRVYGANQDITERKRAEVELKETEERFRIIAETTPVPILISGVADGNVLYGNDQLGQMFGIPIAELIGRPTPDFYFDPADRQVLLTQLRQAGALRDYELHVKRADGTPFWVLVSMRTLVFAGQRALFAAFIDITANRQAAEDLRRSEAQLSEALKTARLAYWELDLARQKFIFNDQLYALLHTTAEAEGGYEMDVNAYVGRFIYPEDIPYVGATIAQGLQNPDPTVSTQLEARVVCADGEVRWLATQVSNKVNEAGQPFKAVGTNQDITERKRAEQEVQRSEQLMRTVIDSTPDWIFIKDQDHRYRLVNQGYANSLHIPVDSFIGKDDLELGFPEDLVKGNPEKGIAGFWADDQAVMTSGQPKVIPNDIVSIDGALRIYNTIKTPLRDIAGQTWAVLAFARDITEREQLMTQQQQRALQLQTAAEVSRATSSILNLDELLPQAAELVRARFNLYYVGIFLNDEPEHWAVLRAGTGDAGQKMLVRGHRLKIGAASMISQCIVKQQAQIALDVGEEAVRFDNPLLPLTRSELALPLISRGRVIGAVSIQSEQPAAFTPDDIIVLQTMADQIGNAIENARLYEQSTAALEEVDALNRRLTGEGWETYLRRGSSQQVIWAGDDETIAPAPLSTVDEQLSAGQIVVEPAPGDEQSSTVSVPVMLRGQAIGALRIAVPEAAYTDELRTTLESLAGHVAQAAENARLLDETQARFARERALAEATDKIRRRPEVEHVLQTAAEELARYLQASAINVRLGASVTAAGETGQPG